MLDSVTAGLVINHGENGNYGNGNTGTNNRGLFNSGDGNYGNGHGNDQSVTNGRDNQVVGSFASSWFPANGAP